MSGPALAQLARCRGIGDAYHDYRGELRSFDLATKAAILAAMGCRVDDAAAVQLEIERCDTRHWRGLLPGIVVARPGHMGVPLTIPAGRPELAMEWRVQLEDGSVRSGVAQAHGLAKVDSRDVEGRALERRILVLPEDLPPGYHTLTTTTVDDGAAACTLVVAPGRCYEPDVLAQGARTWGVSVQLYALRSPSNWGIGDFADLAEVVRYCALQEAAFVGLNPLHALFPADPAHCSPYSPSSRHYLNVLYVSVESLPEYRECEPARKVVGSDAFRATLARLRAAELVDYRGVATAKLPVLRLLYSHFRREHLARDTARARSFRDFQAERGESLRRHALHDAIDEHLRGENPARYRGWRTWPGTLRDPGHAAVQAFERQHADDVEFHEWLQWIADDQLRAVQRLANELGMPIGLYGDLAVGANPAGSETWSAQSVYRTGAAIGAPPDPLALKGQDWGVPPLDPQALAEGGYQSFRELVAANMRQFGALRLDHVMALFRQWWVPAGLPATDGGYVHYPLEDLMSVLALESHRHRCLVIGEDLGTVPDEVRRAMAEFGVYSYKVLLFEKGADGRFRRPGDYARRAIASVTTHDLPTLRAYWEGKDLELRDQLDLFPSADTHRHVCEERERDRAALLAALANADLRPDGVAGPDSPYAPELARAVHLYLARSASALVALQVEDLIGMTDPVNVPGTHEEYANWQRKLADEIADVLGSPGALGLLAEVQAARSRG